MDRARRPFVALVAACVALGAWPGASAHAEPAEWAARHVLIAHRGASRPGPNVTRTKAEALALAQKVVAEVAAGAALADLAKTYSDDAGSASAGGFLGFFERGTMVAPFQTAVEALEPGAVSGVVESEFGFHVIQRLADDVAYELMRATRATIVLAFFPWKGVAPDPTVSRTKEKAKADAEAAAAALKSGSSMASLPATLGASPAAPGFQPQVISRGGIRPEFSMLEAAAFALSPGGVSGAVETPAGYAVLARRPWYRMRVQHLVVLYKGSAASSPSVTRSKDEARARASEALGKYEADKSAWQQVVAEYSEEPDAGARSGSLGVAEPGKFVLEFEDAIADLAAGQHTKVFETPFGFHVARRVP